LRHLSRTTITAGLEHDVPALAEMTGVHDLTREGTQLHFSADTAQLPAIMRALGEHDIRSLTATPPTLEQLLLRHYSDPTGSSSADGSSGKGILTREES
ncbi:MAG: ABC transporter ATP-binding protein, partial [Brevibacterium aurantiacum]